MAPRSLPHLAVAAVAVIALASCSGDDPEPVATGGGLELASTTTEQPEITEPKTTTTTASTTTTTTTTTTTAPATTTTTAPVVPTVEELRATLPPVEALPGGDWDRRDAPTPADADAPTPICDGSTVPTPLTSLLYQGEIAGGAVAQYERADGSGLVRIVVGPLVDAGPRIAEAQAQLPSCPGAVTVVQWPTQGEASVAFTRTRPSVSGAPGEQTFTWVLAHVGPVVVGLEVQAIRVEGQALAAPPTDAEIQAFLQGTLDAAAGLDAG
jgi:hypothetical protein